MGSEDLGFAGTLSMALGGMIGGGIYAVLGVVTGIAGAATWVAFVAAGCVALCAGYSYAKLNAVDERSRGGSVTFVRRYVGNATLAGLIGWTLLVGYLGSMAMYAFAFGEYAIGLSFVPDRAAGVPLRPLLSVLVVAVFVGLNLLGAQATGSAEIVLVAAKIAVLILFGAGAIAVAVFARPEPVTLGFDRLGSFSPIVAAAISFVAFQGWQLPFYDQERIEAPVRTVSRTVFVSIPVAVLIYALVAIATVTLAPAALQHSPHTALANAAGNVLSPVGYGGAGVLIISLSALVSTGSAINATLYSTSFFAKRMASADLLPRRIGHPGGEGLPRRTMLLLGAVTATAAASGSLGGITSFASLSFVAVFGGVNVLAVRERDREGISAVPPALGAIGALAFFPLMLQHLWYAERGTFFTVVAVAAAVVLVELLYVERDAIEEELSSVERTADSRD